MRISVPVLLIALLYSSTGLAQDVRYVSDKQYVPLRSGAGSDYRIVHRGIPSGTRLTLTNSPAQGEWVEVALDNGDRGWIRSQYLMSEVPARLQLSAAAEKAARAGGAKADLVDQIEALETEKEDLLIQITTVDSELELVSQELHQLKQVSGKAVQLDTANRQLAEETENLRSEVEMLQAETQRLTDKLENEDFMNGALAVLLGVIIALVAPRLVPKRRKTSSW